MIQSHISLLNGSILSTQRCTHLKTKIDFSTTKNYFFCTQIAHEQQSSQSIETIDYFSARVFYYRTICYSFAVLTAKWNVLLIYTNFHLTFPTYTLPSCICVLVCVWIRMCVHIHSSSWLPTVTNEKNVRMEFNVWMHTRRLANWIEIAVLLTRKVWIVAEFECKHCSWLTYRSRNRNRNGGWCWCID